jgi:hypothetical protein
LNTILDELVPGVDGLGFGLGFRESGFAESGWAEKLPLFCNLFIDLK